MTKLALHLLLRPAALQCFTTCAVTNLLKIPPAYSPTFSNALQMHQAPQVLRTHSLPAFARMPDRLHPRILYETRTKITTPLKLIFEACLKLKELPHDWVKAKISAVYKKSKKSELCNYWPISLRSILCKIIEQFIRDYIIQHFLHNDHFSKNLFGFLKGRSTMLQLLHIMEEWTAAPENGGQISEITTIYADFAKVPHHLLLKKLQSYILNANVIQWIRSLMCYRKQRVKINVCYSKWIDVISGIPQDTTLGEVLNLHNDLPEICEQFARI